MPRLNYFLISEKLGRHHVDQRVSDIPAHECGGVSDSPALYDTGTLDKTLWERLLTRPRLGSFGISLHQIVAELRPFAHIRN